MTQAERGIFGQVIDGVLERIKSVTRGYSTKDVQTARRILAGEITERDRTRFRIGEKLRIAVQASPGGLLADQLSPTIAVYPNSLSAEIQSLETLTNLEIDEGLKEEAYRKLKRWGKLKP